MENILLYAFATPLQLDILDVYLNVLHSKLSQHPVDLDEDFLSFLFLTTLVSHLQSRR